MATDPTDLFDAAGQRFDVDPSLLRAVFQTESGGNFATPDSSAGAMGGMQIMPATYATVAKRYGLGDDPRNPVNNVMAGAAVLSENLNQFGNVPDALRSYNAGPDQSRWANPQTEAYVGRVAQFYQPQSQPAAPPASTGSGGTAPYQVASADTGTVSDAMPSPSGPPSSSGQTGGSGGTGLTSMSDGALRALLTGSGAAPASTGSRGATAPATGLSASAGGMAGLSDDQMRSLLTGAPPVASAAARLSSGSTSTVGSPATPSASASGTPSPSTSSDPVAGLVGYVDRNVPILGRLDAAAQSAGNALVAGGTTAVEGVPNALNRLGAYVDQNVPGLAAVDRAALPALGMQQPAQTANALTSDIAARDQAYAGNPLYTAGKVAGDLAVTAPVLGAGGAMVKAGLEAAPVVGNALAVGGDAIRALPLGSRLVTLGSNALGGAATGVTAAGVTSGQSQEPIGQQLAEGAATGGILGGAVAPTIGAIGKGIATALNAGSISPETAALANTARTTYGIPLTAAQITESPAMRYVASAAGNVPLAGGGSEDAAAQAAFNAAVSRTFGENATKITPAVMQAAKTRLGAEFDRIAAGTTFPADNAFVGDLSNVETSARSVLGNEAQPVLNQIDNVLSRVDGNGNISGEAYQSLIGRGSDLDRAMASGNSNISYYAGQIRDALDDALSRGVSPDDQAALAAARSQYRAMKTVEPLVGKSTIGNISPPALMTPVRTSYGDIAYTGGGPLGDLARIGQLMKPPPDSGTAGRLGTVAALGSLGTTIGSAVTGISPVAEAMYAGGSLAGTSLAARAVRSYLNSPIVANRLIANGMAGNSGAGPVSNLLMSGITPAGVLATNSQQPNRLAAPRP